jgi:hypothetical protein
MSNFVSYHSTIIKNICETLYVAESEDDEDDYGSDTLDSQSEFRSTISDKSRKFKPPVLGEVYDTTLCV